MAEEVGGSNRRRRAPGSLARLARRSSLRAHAAAHEVSYLPSHVKDLHDLKVFYMASGRIRTGKGSGKHLVFPYKEGSLRKRKHTYSVGKPWVSEKFETSILCAEIDYKQCFDFGEIIRFS